MNRYKVLYTILFWSYVIGMYAQEIQQADSVRRNWSRLTDNTPAVFSIDKIKFGPEPVFEEPPVLTLKEYIKPAVTTNILLPSMFPANPSFLMRRVMIRHMASDSVAGANDKYIKIYMENFYKNLLKGGSLSFQYVPPVEYSLSRFGGPLSVGAGCAFVGVIDPVEMYRMYKKRRREKKTQEVLFHLKDARDFADDLIAYNDYYKRNPRELGTKDIIGDYAVIPRDKVSYTSSLKLEYQADTSIVKKDSLLVTERDTLRVPADTVIPLFLKTDTVGQ
ncbi:hypothetical protein OCV73_03565 [Barnesiella propionica]|uniref:hypothetical protein n=1 Tax=Barnesiella propionica TaxID=2981781 RepID=UPI0011C87249|nr:hypothetical protein [Barnesiella propionica]MCU6768027.1 hypothetical protein [Barnesiella propionica]